MLPTRGIKKKFPTGVIRVERQRLNLQKSASPIVPMKWLTTTEERAHVSVRMLPGSRRLRVIAIENSCSAKIK